MRLGRMALTLSASPLAAVAGPPPVSYVATSDEVWYGLGQSNAATNGVSGSGTLPVGWADNARVQMWNSTTNVFATYSPGTAPTWGPEVNYALDWLALNSGNSYVLYLIKHAVSGTQLGSWTTYGQSSGAPSDWSITDNDHGSNYLLALAKANAAQSWFTTNSKTPVCPVIEWFQGEADSQLPAALADYSTNAQNIYALFRAFPYATTNTKIVSHMVSTKFANYDFFGMTTKQQAVCAAAPTKNFLFDTRGLSYNADTIHLDAPSVNTAGDAIFTMTHGGMVPTALTYNSSPLGTDSPTNTSAGYLTCTTRDNSVAVAWSLVGASNEFVVAAGSVNGVGTIRVKTGATLVQGTYSITVRATTGSGGTADLAVTVTVGAAGTGTWWNAASVATMDFANDQYRINGTNYLGATALAGASRWNASTNSVDLTSIMPTSFTMLCNAVNSPKNPSSSVPNILYALDDGADGIATDEFFAIERGQPSGSGWFMAANKATTSQITATVTFIANYYAPGLFVKTAARGATNDMNFAVNGTASTADTVCAVQNLVRMKLGDRETGSRPWQGDIYRAELLNVATNDAGLIAFTT